MFIVFGESKGKRCFNGDDCQTKYSAVSSGKRLAKYELNFRVGEFRRIEEALPSEANQRVQRRRSKSGVVEIAEFNLV